MEFFDVLEENSQVFTVHEIDLLCSTSATDSTFPNACTLYTCSSTCQLLMVNRTTNPSPKRKQQMNTIFTRKKFVTFSKKVSALNLIKCSFWVGGLPTWRYVLSKCYIWSGKAMVRKSYHKSHTSFPERMTAWVGGCREWCRGQTDLVVMGTSGDGVLHTVIRPVARIGLGGGGVPGQAASP